MTAFIVLDHHTFDTFGQAEALVISDLKKGLKLNFQVGKGGLLPLFSHEKSDSIAGLNHPSQPENLPGDRYLT